MLVFNQKKKYELPEYQQFSKLRLISMIISGIILIGFIVGMYFIYVNIYQTIGQIQSVMLTQSELNTQIIDFERLEIVQKTWNEKHQLELPALARDPFNSLPIKPTSTPSTVKKTTVTAPNSAILR